MMELIHKAILQQAGRKRERERKREAGRKKGRMEEWKEGEHKEKV